MLVASTTSLTSFAPRVGRLGLGAGGGGGRGGGEGEKRGNLMQDGFKQMLLGGVGLMVVGRSECGR